MGDDSRRPDAQQQARPRRRVLVVDDDPGMRRLLRTALERVACTAVLAENGEQALSLVQHEPVDAVLLDVNLPGVDGLTVLAALKQAPQTRHLPVIMLTGRGDEEAQLRAREAGAAAYLLKPCSPRVFQRVILDVIGS